MTQRSHDAGFGMVEIVVSIFMLGVLAIAFLPVLIQGLKTSVRNSTLASATQLVDQSIEMARSTEFAACADLESFALQTAYASSADGTQLIATRSLPLGCSEGSPQLLVVSVATSAAPGELLASATTHVLVAP